jgi:hypothetical protein
MLTKRILFLSVFLSTLFWLSYVRQTSSQAELATLVLDPSTQTVAVNGTFTVTIRLNTGGQSVNTVAANLTYDQSAVTPQSIDTTGSFVTIWFENNIASSNGEVRLTGSVPSPGVNGDNLLFARVNFTANQASTSQVSFLEDSAVFRDSDNVDILSSTTGSVITVSDSAVTPTPPSATPGVTTTPGPTTTLAPGTPTPTALPDAGIISPTIVIFIVGVLLLIIAIGLLV